MPNSFKVIYAHLLRTAAKEISQELPPPGTRVRVYHNRTDNKCSIQVFKDGKWKLVASVDAIALDDSHFYIYDKTRVRVIENNKKEVHAGVEGTVAFNQDFDHSAARRVRYTPIYRPDPNNPDPRIPPNDHFYFDDTHQTINHREVQKGKKDKNFDRFSRAFIHIPDPGNKKIKKALMHVIE